MNTLDGGLYYKVCNKLSKMIHFVAIIEGTSAERLVRLFWNNM